MITGARILEIARGEIGIRELPPGSNIVKYSRWYGLTGPWCGMFVSWVYDQAGSRDVRFAYCPAMVDVLRARGQWNTGNPQPGDLVFFDFFSSRPSLAYHVGILVRYPSSTTIETIDGNTGLSSEDNGGSVMTRIRPTRFVLGIGSVLPRPGSTVIETPNGSQPLPDLFLSTPFVRGPHVRALQAALGRRGFMPEGGVDGVFGPGTDRAVRAYQRSVGLVADGWAGPKTLASLGVRPPY